MSTPDDVRAVSDRSDEGVGQLTNGGVRAAPAVRSPCDDTDWLLARRHVNVASAFVDVRPGLEGEA